MSLPMVKLFSQHKLLQTTQHNTKQNKTKQKKLNHTLPPPPCHTQKSQKISWDLFCAELESLKAESYSCAKFLFNLPVLPEVMKWTSEQSLSPALTLQMKTMCLGGFSLFFFFKFFSII